MRNELVGTATNTTMNRAVIPEDVRRFILTSIPSVPFLEAVLLLRNEPKQAWDAKKVARRLYLSEKNSQDLLSELCATGFASMVENSAAIYRYHPVSDELRLMMDQVAEIYPKQIVEVSNLIHSNISKQAQQFADAFKWRKDA